MTRDKLPGQQNDSWANNLGQTKTKDACFITSFKKQDNFYRVDRLGVSKSELRAMLRLFFRADESWL